MSCSTREDAGQLYDLTRHEMKKRLSQHAQHSGVLFTQRAGLTASCQQSLTRTFVAMSDWVSRTSRDVDSLSQPRSDLPALPTVQTGTVAIEPVKRPSGVKITLVARTVCAALARTVLGRSQHLVYEGARSSCRSFARQLSSRRRDRCDRDSTHCLHEDLRQMRPVLQCMASLLDLAFC